VVGWGKAGQEALTTRRWAWR